MSDAQGYEQQAGTPSEGGGTSGKTDRQEDEMWTKMRNLVCKAGHWHYSPTPRAFANRECFCSTGEKARCQEKLRHVPQP